MREIVLTITPVSLILAAAQVNRKWYSYSMRKDKPSFTAYKVALSLVTLGTIPEMREILPNGIVEATETLLVASGAASVRKIGWARSPRMVSVYKAFDWVLPGQFEAFASRKAFCEQQVRDGIHAGATQILTLGAGYDTLGWRLAPEFSAVEFFEIDHPATAKLKQTGITAMGQHKNLHLIAADLSTQKLMDVLANHESWRQHAQTVIIAEGLVMYLSCHAVRDLFSQCAASSGVSTRFAFSYIPTGEDGRLDAGPRTGLMLWLQKMIGEPWLWSIRPEELGSFLEGIGWKLVPDLAGASNKHGIEMYGVCQKV